MIFYAPQVSGKHIVLDAEESRHAIKVLRLSEGSPVEAVDGRGGFYRTLISDPNPKRCQLLIQEKIANYGARRYQVHLAIAPTKNINRFEWLLEKATEVGVDTITPLLCMHSERKVIKPERLEKILISAIKQSQKARMPELRPMQPVADFLAQHRGPHHYIAHCQPGSRQPLAKCYPAGHSATILIGPEGDFDAQEISQAVAAGYISITLGKERLRTETAGLAAVHTLSVLNQL